MKKSSAVILILVLFSWTRPQSAPACPVVLGIWDLARRADLVVLARVRRVEITVGRPDDEGFELKFGILEVLDTWKGTRLGELRVSDPPQSAPEGALVVAFLERGDLRTARLREVERANADADAAEAEEEVEESLSPEMEATRRKHRAIQEEWDRQYEAWAVDRWFVVGFSDGFLAIEDSDRDVFEELIARAVALQSAGPVDETKRRDWLVSAAERRAMRTHGLPALPSHSETLFSDDVEWEVPEPLSENQLKRLARGFVQEPAVDPSDLMMLRVLAGYRDPDVDRAAASVIEAGLLLRPIPWWVAATVDELLKRYGDDFSARIGRDDRDPRGRPIYTGQGENTLTTIWEVARRELGIPQVPPAEAPVRSTRESTPD